MNSPFSETRFSLRCLACDYSGEDFAILPVDVSVLSRSYPIAFCPKCGLGKTMDIMPDDLSRINQIYYGDTEGRIKNYYYYLYHHLQVRYLQTLQLIRRFAKGNQLLEVGSNIGFTLNIAARQGFQATGCEINVQMRKLTEAIYHLPVEADFFQLASCFDIIVMNDVLEHFPDPLAALHKTHQILNNDGIIFIQLPNIASKRFKKLKDKWEFLIPPDHTYHFNSKSLQLVAEKAGFRQLWHRTVNSVEDFSFFGVLPHALREKFLFMIHHNPWYWPPFYEAKKDHGSILQMLFSR